MKSCTWFFHLESGAFLTECGNAHTMVYDGIDQCPYCGRTISVEEDEKPLEDLKTGQRIDAALDARIEARNG